MNSQELIMNSQEFNMKFQEEMSAIFATSFIVPFSLPDKSFSQVLYKLLFRQFEEHKDFNRFFSCDEETISSVFFLYLQVLIDLRSYITKGAYATLSKLSNQTIEFGFGELLDSGFVHLDDNYTIQTEQRSNYKTMKLYKQDELQAEAFQMLKLSPYTKNLEQIKKPIFVNTMRTNANSIKKNNGYCNCIINWDTVGKYSFPIDKTDIVFTICRYFRLFDSAICRLINATTDFSRITKQAYSHYTSLAEEDFIKKFIAYDSSSPTGNMRNIDSIIHNFELERLFHFSLLADILKIRQIAETKFSKNKLEKLDSLFLLFSDLSLSYKRNERLKRLFSDDKLNELSSMDDSQYNEFIREKEKELSIDARYVWPIMQRTVFYTLILSQKGKTLNENFILASNYINDELKSHENITFARIKWEKNSINKLPDVKSLSISAVNFIYRFFTYNFTIAKYNERNNQRYNSDYFNLPIITTENTERRSSKNIVQDITLDWFLSK